MLTFVEGLARNDPWYCTVCTILYSIIVQYERRNLQAEIESIRE